MKNARVVIAGDVFVAFASTATLNAKTDQMKTRISNGKTTIAGCAVICKRNSVFALKNASKKWAGTAV